MKIYRQTRMASQQSEATSAHVRAPVALDPPSLSAGMWTLLHTAPLDRRHEVLDTFRAQHTTQRVQACHNTVPHTRRKTRATPALCDISAMGSCRRAVHGAFVRRPRVEEACECLARPPNTFAALRLRDEGVPEDGRVPLVYI
jgi:hypothetical protein